MRIRSPSCDNVSFILPLSCFDGRCSYRRRPHAGRSRASAPSRSFSLPDVPYSHFVHLFSMFTVRRLLFECLASEITDLDP